MRITERSDSAFNSPTLLAKEPGGTHRFCFDFRELNQTLVSEGEPILRADCLLAEGRIKNYFFNLGMRKGYWQVPLSAVNKAMTVFSTPSGYYQFRHMLFGVKTATALFAKLIRRFIDDVPDAHHCYDDLLVATDSWELHLETLRDVSRKIADAGEAVKMRGRVFCNFPFSDISSGGKAFRLAKPPLKRYETRRGQLPKNGCDRSWACSDTIETSF